MSDPRDAYERSQALTDADPSRGDAPADQPSSQQPSSPEPQASGNGGGAEPLAGDAPKPEQVGTPDAADDPDRERRAANVPDAEEVETPGEGVPAATDEEDELTRVRRERDEYLDHLRRERAEFENFRKRTARDKLEAMDRGVQSLMTELLGVLDDFGHVLAASEDTSDPALAKGAELVHTQLTGVLTRFGLEEVPGEGAPFDPQWHEAMMQVPADDDVDEPVVAQVLRPGYRFKGRVIRPASVSVAQ